MLVPMVDGGKEGSMAPVQIRRTPHVAVCAIHLLRKTPVRVFMIPNPSEFLIVAPPQALDNRLHASVRSRNGAVRTQSIQRVIEMLQKVQIVGGNVQRVLSFDSL